MKLKALTGYFFNSYFNLTQDNLANKVLKAPFTPTYDNMATPEEIDEAIDENISFMHHVTGGKQFDIVRKKKLDKWEEYFL